ncbi:hypothetical protein [Streptomyces sp. NPDC059928]|uniref:hypothetical protein n=1 Tax=unclassified Streptomyces TaxID=2593676 RepID=UPI00365BBBF6
MLLWVCGTVTARYARLVALTTGTNPGVNKLWEHGLEVISARNTAMLESRGRPSSHRDQ